MHPKLARLVLRGQACGARLSFGRGYCCAKPAVHGMKRLRDDPPPHRCRFHGGLSTGVVGNQNARKTLGLYANLLLPGEEAWLADLATDDLSFEISMMKVRLRRIAEAELNYDENDDRHVMEVVEKSELPALVLSLRKKAKVKKGTTPQKVKPPKMVVVERTVIRKRPDFANAMAVAARQLVKMMETQALLKGKGAFSDEAKKEMARNFIKECKAVATSGKAGDPKPKDPDAEDEP